MSTQTDVEPQTETKRPATRRLANSSMPIVIVGAVLATIISFTADSSLGQGGAATVLLVLLLLLRVPIAISLGVSGIVGIMAIAPSLSVTWSTVASVPFETSASWTLSVLPMFILMGLLMWHTGIAERVYDAARAWLSWLPGGLAITTTAAGAGLSSASGSTLGITYALGRIAPPEMLKSGYDRRLATGSVMTVGTVGGLIPPSILLVIFAGVAGTPVGPQILAGLVPGVLLALAYMVAILVLAILVPKVVGGKSGDRESIGWAERMRVLLRVWPVPVLFLIVVGGLYSGVMTPTEAGAFGAAGAVLLALVLMGSRRGGTAIFRASVETVSSVGAIMFVLVGAGFFNRMLVLSGLAQAAADFVASLGLPRLGLVALLAVILLFLGMFLEASAMILLVVPIMMPIIAESDLSMLWFGVFVVLMAEIAAVSPPVGLLAFVMHKIVQRPEVNLGHKISLADIFVAGLAFVPIALLLVAALTVFPEIVEWLPNISGSG